MVVTLGSESAVDDEELVPLGLGNKSENKSLKSFLVVPAFVSLNCVLELEDSVLVIVALINCLLTCRGK